MSTVSEIQDMVRRKIGVPNLDPEDLKMIMAWGRSELESRGNYYYGVALKDTALTASTQSYSLTSSTGAGFGLTNYKEHRSLFIREVSGANWLPLPIGGWDSALPDHSHTVSNKPQAAVIENDTIYFLPTPDAAYPIRLYHFNWTTNPESLSGTDELFTRWSQAIYYACMFTGKNFTNNSQNAGAQYEELMMTQVERLKDFTNRRMEDLINTMSTREAAQVLQASGGQPQ
jgi:hypothetical protein